MPDAGLIDWLREQCGAYVFDLRGVYRRGGRHDWPLTASNEGDLERLLDEGGHLLPLPKEPAALANVLEVSLVDFLLERVAAVDGAHAVRGTERGYPDIEISGPAFGGGFHAIDIKMAKRGRSGNLTQSRVTLYTGNTYFRHPTLHWPGTFRPFDDYITHLDVIGVYTLNSGSAARVEELELIVQEPWRIASRQRSSTTREYIGAVQRIADLRDGRGEFATAKEFYVYWRKFRFRVPPAVQNQLDRLVQNRQVTPGTLFDTPDRPAQ